MDIYSYINSKDIAAHCRNLNHSFTPLDAAYLIWHSRRHTIPEKHAAWGALIETTPDMAIPGTEHPSLHRFLRDYMGVETRLLDAFHTEGTDITYRYAMDCGERSDPFQSLAELTAHLQTVLAETARHDLAYISLYRHHAGMQRMHLNVRPDAAPLHFGARTFNLFGGALRNIFFTMCPALPVPFNRGDLVAVRALPTHDLLRTGRGCKEEICVFESAGAQAAQRLLTQHGYLWHGAQDTRPANDYAVLYSVGEDGYLHHFCSPFFLEEISPNYLDLEHYHGSLSGRQRILQAVSRYLQGGIDLSLLVNAHYATLIEENSCDQLREFHGKWLVYDVPLHLVGRTHERRQERT